MTAPYRVSSLAFAFVRMWRGWRVIVPVIVLNALIQAVLVWPPFTYGSGAWTVGAAIVSAIAMAAGFAAIAASGPLVAEGPVHWAPVTGAIRDHALPYLLWTLAWGLAVAIGFALFVVPGLVVIALTPFLAIAVLDGQARPLRTNVEVMRARMGRWLITILIVILLGVICWEISGFLDFFLRDPVAPLLVWLVGGWLVAWFVTAFGLIYRGARAAAPALELSDAGKSE